MKNTYSWVLWLATSLLMVLSTRNPFYLSILLISLLITGQLLAKQKNHPLWVVNNLRFLLTMLILSALINTLFTHTGRSVIFSLPENWLLIGGNITYESLVFGLINGLVIGGIYITFNIINLALSIRQLTHLIPKAFRPIGMTATIALTFFPSIQQRAREIKEAQMIRGNPMKRISDWVPLFIPLLVTSLENAILLSASMTSRGFYRQQTKSKPSDLPLISLILSAFMVFSGWILRMYGYPKLISTLLYIAAATIIFLTLFLTGRRSHATQYHHEIWHKKDITASILSMTAILFWTLLNYFQQIPSVSYSPYPTLTLPNIQPPYIVFLIVPLLPVILQSDD